MSVSEFKRQQAAQIYGKFEASGSGGTGQGNGVEILAASRGVEVDGIFNNEKTAVTIDSGALNSRIIEVVSAPNHDDVIGQGHTDYVEIHNGR